MTVNTLLLSNNTVNNLLINKYNECDLELPLRIQCSLRKAFSFSSDIKNNLCDGAML